jgi:hypothetical protein
MKIKKLKNMEKPSIFIEGDNKNINNNNNNNNNINNTNVDNNVFIKRKNNIILNENKTSKSDNNNKTLIINVHNNTDFNTPFRIKKSTKIYYKENSYREINYSYKILKLKSLNSIYSNKLSCLFTGILKKNSNNKSKTIKVVDKNTNKEKNYIKKGAAIITKTSKLLGILLMNNLDNYIFIPLESLAFILKKFSSQLDFLQNNIKKISDLEFNLIPFGIAINSYNLDTDFFNKILKPQIIKADNMYKVLIINSINYSDESSFKDNNKFKVKPGDIVYKLNNIIVGNDLLLINRIIDENINKDSLSFHVIRNGKIIEKKLILRNQDLLKVKKIAKLSDGYFYELNNYFHQEQFHKLNKNKGLYLTYYEKNSPFRELAIRDKFNKPNFSLKAISSFEVINLNQLKEIFIDKLNCKFEGVYFEGFDMNYNINSHLINSLNLKSSIPKDKYGDKLDLIFYEFLYDERNFEWKRREVNFNKECIDRSDLPIVNLNKTTYEPVVISNVGYDSLSDEGLLPLDRKNFNKRKVMKKF